MLFEGGRHGALTGYLVSLFFGVGVTTTRPSRNTRLALEKGLRVVRDPDDGGDAAAGFGRRGGVCVARCSASGSVCVDSSYLLSVRVGTLKKAKKLFASILALRVPGSGRRRGAPRSRVVAARLVGSRRRRNRRRRRSRRLERFGHFQDGGLSPPLPREVAPHGALQDGRRRLRSTANAAASVAADVSAATRARASSAARAAPGVRPASARLLVSASPQRRSAAARRACVLRTAKDARRFRQPREALLLGEPEPVFRSAEPDFVSPPPDPASPNTRRARSRDPKEDAPLAGVFTEELDECGVPGRTQARVRVRPRVRGRTANVAESVRFVVRRLRVVRVLRVEREGPNPVGEFGASPRETRLLPRAEPDVAPRTPRARSPSPRPTAGKTRARAARPPRWSPPRSATPPPRRRRGCNASARRVSPLSPPTRTRSSLASSSARRRAARSRSSSAVRPRAPSRRWTPRPPVGRPRFL